MKEGNFKHSVVKSLFFGLDLYFISTVVMHGFFSVSLPC